jgi:hypothetical protein
MFRSKLLAPMAIAAFLAGCTDAAKGPAEQAIQATDATLAAVKADAAKYAGERLEGVERGLATAREAYAKGDFKGALASAKDLPARATALAAAVATRKQEEAREFDVATAQLPQLLEGLRNQLGELKADKRRARKTDAAVEAARDELGAITRALDEATALATAGKLAEATAAARPLRERSLALASRVAALSATPAR